MGGIFDVLVLDAHATHEDIKNHYLIGSCNNILIGNNPPPLMMLSKEYDYIKIEDNALKIGAATPSGKIASFCKKHDIANFEFVSHLPGKLGGLVYMNAGLKEYEIFNNLLNITTLFSKQNKNEIEYGYRYTNIKEPILEATFALEYGFDTQKVAMFKEMRANQPSTPSAGSCFKNPKGDYAGRLIEAVGLKGVLQGDMCFSNEHANFLVNNGSGVFEDAVYLINEAQKRVYKEFGILLELEIQVLDINFKVFRPE
jgi:UDP-N-acetylmuramate dehydrogenase